jgi:integrase
MAKTRRTQVNLTDLKVKHLKPDPAGEYVQGDTQMPGFGVRMRPHGTATFIVMKRLPGGTAPLRMTLGRVGEIGLAEARDKARQAIAAVRRGVDVNSEKRRARDAVVYRREEAQQVRAETGFDPDTFGEIAIRYIGQECARLARGGEIENIIRRSLLDAWGNRPLAELRRRDLNKLLDPIVEAGRIQAAHKLREVAVRIVNWAIERDEIDDIEVNLLAPPRGRGKGNGALKRARRDRVLSEPEIRANWMACDLVDPPLFGVLIRLYLLLGQRRSEVAGMEWPELDLDRGLWEISASRYKTRLPHVVPLPPPAVELLQELPRVDEVYVFSTEPGTHFSGFSKSMDRLRRLSGTAGWTIHDLRRTARTGMSPLKNAAGHRVGAEIAERVLGHVVGGVRGIYDRYAYLDEKREALDLWAARIGEIVSPPPPNNVIPLRAVARR